MLAVLKRTIPGNSILLFCCFVAAWDNDSAVKRFKFGQIQRRMGLRVINPKGTPQSED